MEIDFEEKNTELRKFCLYTGPVGSTTQPRLTGRSPRRHHGGHAGLAIRCGVYTAALNKMYGRKMRVISRGEEVRV